MYPIQLNLTNKTVVIVGGGKIAYRKFLNVMDAKKVKVISPNFNDAFMSHNNVTLISKRYERNDIKDADLIIIATNDPYVNDQVAHDAAPHQWINHTGDRRQSDFYNMKTIQHKDVTISISTEGNNCKKSRLFGEWLKKQLHTLKED